MKENETNNTAKKCKHCGSEMPKGVKVCPNCGKKQGGKVKWIIIVLAVIIIIGATMSGSDDTDSKEADVAEVTQAEEQQPEEEISEEEPEEPGEPEEPAVQTWKDGMYKVGTDIPAGEYVLIATASGYFQIDSDSTGELESIIANENFNTNSIVTVAEGQYLTLNRCVAYAIDDAPELDITKEGMFKVGKDIPAGEYKIHSDGSGYVEVSSSSSHLLDNIISNDNFDGDSYITVSDGQYLTLTRACIVQ